jgi:3-keto-5-aminohexanoate cleavage enzyme
MLPLLDKVITSGGHIQLGLGDHPYAEIGRPSNAELIARIARRARELGRDVATPAEVRGMLDMSPR